MKPFVLNTGQTYPGIGFGTWQIEPDTTAEAMTTVAIDAGYRLIDTARIYGNERGVGSAVRNSAVPREELFVTTKLWNDDQGYDSALKAFDASLERLGLDYIDLYLIHWPATDRRHDAWRALQDIAESGRAHAIGVSNYNIDQLKEVLAAGGTKPAVNQIELHPFIYLEQKATVDFCLQQGIVVEAYSPLAQAGKLHDETIGHIAEAHGVTPAQVMLRWALQHQTIPLPRSTNPGRIAQNIDIFNFELTNGDMNQLDNLEQSGSIL